MSRCDSGTGGCGSIFNARGLFAVRSAGGQVQRQRMATGVSQAVTFGRQCSLWWLHIGDEAVDGRRHSTWSDGGPGRAGLGRSGVADGFDISRPAILFSDLGSEFYFRSPLTQQSSFQLMVRIGTSKLWSFRAFQLGPKTPIAPGRGENWPLGERF